MSSTTDPFLVVKEYVRVQEGGADIDAAASDFF